MPSVMSSVSPVSSGLESAGPAESGARRPVAGPGFASPRHLNYGHLRQFHEVATEGSVVRAAERLHLTPQTVSGQVKLLEEAVGEPLFERVGRGLALTETGRLVHEYSTRIFAIGGELAHRLRHGTGGTETLRIGIVDAVPKLVACRVLAPVLRDASGANGDTPHVRLRCQEGSLETLLGRLAAHDLDLVLSDRPVPTGFGIRAWNHPLGESAIGFYAAPAIADELAEDFPRSLDDAAVLLPDPTNALRRRLDTWFDSQGIEPRTVAEFADGALMKTFGDAALGAFPAPVAMRAAIERNYHATLLGTCDGVTEQLVAIAPERRLRHPSVVRLVEAARDGFGSATPVRERPDAVA